MDESETEVTRMGVAKMHSHAPKSFCCSGRVSLIPVQKSNQGAEQSVTILSAKATCGRLGKHFGWAKPAIDGFAGRRIGWQQFSRRTTWPRRADLRR